MKITMTINGHQVEAEVDEKAICEAMGEKKKTGYESADFYETYFSQEVDGTVVERVYKRGEVIHERIALTGNHYTDKNVAENNARADALMRKLRRFAAEHGGCTSGKRGGSGESAHIILGRDGKPIATDVVRNQAGAVDFCSKEAAKEAIDVFYDDLLWYFTVYDPMPEGWW